MKILLAAAFSFVLVLSAAARGGAQSDVYELALIIALGKIDDKSFNQGAWEGLKQYAEEHNISHGYYQQADQIIPRRAVADEDISHSLPTDQVGDVYLNAICLAVQSGAKVLVAPGFFFETSIYIAQDRYPDVRFILADGTPNNGDYSSGSLYTKVGDNTVSVLYAEEQAGFLAGYAAVKDGCRKLGFMGGMEVPGVIRYGYGYVQGAEYAAQELGLEEGSVTINYCYTGTFDPSPDIEAVAAAWYSDGIEVVFSCGGGIFFSIFPAAEHAGMKVIGVDIDQSGESEAVITSAMKLLAKSIYDCVAAFYRGEFPGGRTLIYKAENQGIGLSMETSRFNSFSKADYDTIYAKLADKSVVVDNSVEIAPDEIPTRAVVVNNMR